MVSNIVAFLNGNSESARTTPGHSAWTQKMWVKEISLKVKGETVSMVYRRPYAYNALTGGVITAQNKAWMDTVTMCLFLECSLAPWFNDILKVLSPHMCYDNCGPHKTVAVAKTMSAAGIAGDSLAPNITDHMQVVDLVINGPLKAHMRKEAAMHLYEEFGKYRISASFDRNAKWAPAVIGLNSGIAMYLKVHESMTQDEKLSKGVVRAFVATGLLPRNDGTFAIYNGRKEAVSWQKLMEPFMQNADSHKTEEFCLSELMSNL